MKEKTSWSIADLIDLEYFSAQDQDRDEEELIRRDREIHARAIAQDLPPNRATDGLLLKSWLEARRRAAGGEGDTSLLPGRLWAELYRLFSLGMAGAGLLLGAGFAWGFLAYTGRQPVNVAVFLSLFVGVQLVLLALLALAFGYRILLGRAGAGFPLLVGLVSRSFSLLARRVCRTGLGRLSAARRRALMAVLGGFRARSSRYGNLMLWPFFLLLQLFAITYNLGIVLVLLFKVTLTDIAFGWQSSLDLSAAAVHRLVAWLALPWSWLLPAGTGYPTVEQIEGSRLILKEGIYHLSTTNLVSWWPFLCLALLCYGLLPRLLLYGLGSLRLHRLLARPDFSPARFCRILRRMRTPSLATRAEEELTSSRAEPEEPAPPQEPPAAEKAAPVPEEGPGRPGLEEVVVLVPVDLEEDFSPAMFDRLATPVLGGRKARIRFFDTEEEALEAVKSLGRDAGCMPDVFLLQEGWQPPINEALAFLAALRDLLGPDREITLLLVGKPTPETMFTPVADQDLAIWQARLAALADVELHIRELVTP